MSHYERCIMKLGKKTEAGTFVAVIAATLFAATIDAATYYVDPTGGDVSSDDYDGTAETWEGPGSNVGPKKTLAEVMKNRVSGDVVIALPGYYNEGVSNPTARDSGTTLMRRVTIPSGVTLKSKCGPEVTFIIGESSTAPNATDTGCGTNAVGCVLNSGTLRGFTVTGGRTLGKGSNDNHNAGGGVNSGTVVDCIISNNACSYRGGGTHYANLYYCRFSNNKGSGASSNGGTAYSCYYADGENSEMLACDAAYGCTLKGFPRGSTLYNCIVLANGATANNKPKFYRCLYVKQHDDDTYYDGCVKISSSQITVDKNGVVTSGLDLIRDKGNNNYYSSAWKTGSRFFDVVGNSRILNGTTDIGASEYNPTGEVSQVLSQEGAVAVTNVSSTVVCLEDYVSIGPGGKLAGVLNMSESETPTTWSFVAEVKGAGTLNVFFGDDAEPTNSLTSADGQVEVQYSGSSPTGVRLVYDGEDGSAEVRDFSRDTVLSIVATEGGLAVAEDYTEPGVYVVAPGETKTIIVSRSTTATRFVSGVNVNGVFYDFNGYLDGVSFAVTGSVRTSSLHIEAVYATTHEWFVDADNGNDDYCGLYTNLAFKTLAAAAAVAKTSGDKILAAPGVYNEGGMYSSTYGSNRVIVAGGVLLEGYGGADVTAIEGKISSAYTSGCGPDSMRAVRLGSGAVMKGFTVRKGRPNYPYPAGEKNNANGGGVLGGLAVECVFSNNVASYRGNAASSASLLRCYIGNDPTGSYSVYSGVTLIDCLHNSNAYGYSGVTSYNTTFVRGYASGTSSSSVTAYNSVYLGNSPSYCHMYNCVSIKAQASTVVNSDGRSVFSVPAADLAYDSKTYRPLSTSLAVDAGNSSYYGYATNGWSKLRMSFVGPDYAGGQRLYNGAIDAGCGEYDWRDGFTEHFATKGVSVLAASGNVTTNAVLGLDVPAGNALTMKLELKFPGEVTLNIAADNLEAVQVLVDQVPVEIGEGGVASFLAGVGESVIEISCSEGTATVSSVALPKQGVLLLVR